MMNTTHKSICRKRGTTDNAEVAIPLPDGQYQAWFWPLAGGGMFNGRTYRRERRAIIAGPRHKLP